MSSLRFVFTLPADMKAIEATLDLARISTAILHGEDKVGLQVPITVDHTNYMVDLDTSFDTGETMALLFLGLIRREFPALPFRTERTHGCGGVL